MNIAIDLAPIPKTKAGVGIYMVNLIDSLQKLDKTNNYYLFVQSDDLDSFKILNDNFTVVPVNSKLLRKTWLRLLWEQFVLPFRLKKHRIDLLHSPHYTMPYLKLSKGIVTFHDMNFFIIPGMHTLAKRILLKIYMYLTLKLSNGILAVSEVVEQDTRRFFRVKKPIFVSNLGVDQKFFTQDNNDAFVRSLGIEGEYFLYVGTIEPRKNLVRVFQAFRSLPENVRSKYKIVVCGKKGWLYDDVFEYVKKNDLKDSIIFTGPVDHNNLPALYKGSKLFLYVSVYEGFGIPVLEAMASGVPCITSDISNLKLIAGDACIKVDPYDFEQIRNAIMEIIDDEKLYNELKDKGAQRAKNYTWEECGKKTLAAYQEILRK